MSVSKYPTVKKYFKAKAASLLRRIITLTKQRYQEGTIGSQFKQEVKEYLADFFPRLEEALCCALPDSTTKRQLEDYVYESVCNLKGQLDDDYDYYALMATYPTEKYKHSERGRIAREARLDEAAEKRELNLPRSHDQLNSITWRWDPETINLRQIEWLMARKRRIYKEQRIDEFMFNYEMKQLAILRKREIEKQSRK